MFHESLKGGYDISYADALKHVLQPDDMVVFYKYGKILLNFINDTDISIPCYNEAAMECGENAKDYRILFLVGARGVYLYVGSREPKRFKQFPVSRLMELEPDDAVFVAITASHLAYWYDVNRYCGRCAASLRQKEDERAMVCPKCGQVIYPRISPVIIVAVTDNDRLLLTRYNKKHTGYQKYALVAGFVETGETLEMAVARELWEEVGLKVKNIRYYKSQPWGFSGSLLMGFYAEVDGSRKIKIEEDELSEGKWFFRNEIPEGNSTASLTWDMIEKFRKGID